MRAADGSTTSNIGIYAVGDQPPSGSAFVMQIDGSDISQYSITFPMGNDDEPQVSAGEADFGVSGTFFDMAGGEPVQGRFEVSCDG